MVNRAIETLERAIDSAPRHIGLREKLREILIDAGRRDHAAQQCLALASLHISAGDIEHANERLLEAKRLDPRVSVTGQFRDIRRTDAAPARSQKILSGLLLEINLFDIIQIVENSRLTGALMLTSSVGERRDSLQRGPDNRGEVPGRIPAGQLWASCSAPLTALSSSRNQTPTTSTRSRLRATPPSYSTCCAPKTKRIMAMGDGMGALDSYH